MNDDTIVMSDQPDEITLRIRAAIKLARQEFDTRKLPVIWPRTISEIRGGPIFTPPEHVLSRGPVLAQNHGKTSERFP